MAVIPPFEADGLLRPGDYEVSFDELRQSILVVGLDGAPRSLTWDSAWRAKLVDNLEILTRQLWQVGASSIFWTPTRSGRGTRHLEDLIADIRSGNSRCGTSIASSFIRMFQALALEAASGTGMAMSWNSLQRFASRDVMANREAS